MSKARGYGLEKGSFYPKVSFYEPPTNYCFQSVSSNMNNKNKIQFQRRTLNTHVRLQPKSTSVRLKHLLPTIACERASESMAKTSIARKERRRRPPSVISRDGACVVVGGKDVCWLRCRSVWIVCVDKSIRVRGKTFVGRNERQSGCRDGS